LPFSDVSITATSALTETTSDLSQGVPSSLREESGSGQVSSIYEVFVCDVLGTPTAATAVQRIGELLKEGRVAKAEGLCRALLCCHPNDSDLQRLALLLEHSRPRAINYIGSNARLDAEWLSKHGSRYAGKWVVLSDGELLAAEPSLQVALACARKKGKVPLFVHRVSGTSTGRP
jgi:hypothetical protein